MTTVHVSYRYEEEGWWAESPDVPGWTAVGETFQEVRVMACAGIIEFVGQDTLIEEQGVPLSMNMGDGVWATAASQAKMSGGGVLVIASSAIPAVPGRHPFLRGSALASFVPDERLSKQLPDCIQKTG